MWSSLDNLLFKSMMVMVMMVMVITCNKLLFQSMMVMVMVIIFRQPLVQEHDGDSDDGDDDHL